MAQCNRTVSEYPDELWLLKHPEVAAAIKSNDPSNE